MQKIWQRQTRSLKGSGQWLMLGFSDRRNLGDAAERTSDLRLEIPRIVVIIHHHLINPFSELHTYSERLDVFSSDGFGRHLHHHFHQPFHLEPRTIKRLTLIPFAAANLMLCSQSPGHAAALVSATFSWLCQRKCWQMASLPTSCSIRIWQAIRKSLHPHS